MRRNLRFCNHSWVAKSRPGIVGMLDRKAGARRTHNNIVTCTTVSFRMKRKQEEGPHGSVRLVSQAASLIKTTLLVPIEMVTTHLDRYAIC
jgi:hypothetical protein